MKVNIRVRGHKNSSRLAVWAKEKITDSFSRLSMYIKNIEAFISDLNGPKGGKSQNLLIAVRLWNGNTIAVREIDVNIGRALDSGVDRSLQSLIKEVHREHSKRRIAWNKFQSLWLPGV